jgi:hypothetical protein
VTVNGSANGVSVLWFETPPAGVELAATLAGSSITVTLDLDRAVPAGDYSGDVLVTDTSGGTYLIPFWVRVANR